MDYRVFQYGIDDIYIKDIVNGLASMDKVVSKSETWFRMRFEQNPLGKAILACAFDGDRLVACVVLEKVPLECEIQHLIGCCFSCYFVRPDHESQKMLADLLEIAEEEAKNNGMGMIFTLNVLNVRDFGWTYCENKVHFRLTPVTGIWRSLFKLLDSTRPFVPDAKCGCYMEKDENECEELANTNMVVNYYNWLYQTSQKKHIIINDENVYAVAIVGHRGKRVKDAHICYMESKSRSSAGHHLMEVIKGQYKDERIDVVSCLEKESYFSKKASHSTSQSLSYCYKIIGKVEYDKRIVMMLDNIVYMY